MPKRLTLPLAAIAFTVVLAWAVLAVTADQPTVHIFFFFSPDCSFCETAVQEVLTPLKQKYGAQLEIRSFDTSYLWNYLAMLDLEERYQVADGGTPEVYLGNRCLSGLNEIRSGLDGLIADGLKAGGMDYPLPDLMPVGEPTSALGATEALTPVPTPTLAAAYSPPSSQGCSWCGAVTVSGAGLIGGVNPCVLSDVVFLVSCLAVAKRKRHELLIIGAMYTLGVLVSYLLVGVGILGLARQLSFIRGLSRTISLATMAGCGLLAVISVYEWVQVRRGRGGGIALRLPRPLQERVHTILREGSMARNLAWCALAMGFRVALIELLCTGLVYLPTIVLITTVAELRAHALIYTAVFSLFAIVPLMVPFMLIVSGSTWRALNRFLESNLTTLKLMSAALFAVLALWLGIYAL